MEFLLGKRMRKELFDLSSDVAVVIGGTGSLGGAIAEALASYGAHVVISGRSKERGESRVTAIRDMGGKATFWPVDVTDRERLVTARGEIEAELGSVSVLVNAAGGNRPNATPFSGQPVQRFDVRSMAKRF